MPQNTKDNNGGKSSPVKDTAPKGGITGGNGKADQKVGSPAGSQNKGKKKTTT